MEHSSNLSMLEVKHLAVEELTKRCSKMSAEIVQMKKVIENVSKLKVKFAKSLHPPFHVVFHVCIQYTLYTA